MSIQETISRDQVQIEAAHLDDDYFYNKFLEEKRQEEEAINRAAEMNEFINILNCTGTYPF